MDVHRETGTATGPAGRWRRRRGWTASVVLATVVAVSGEAAGAAAAPAGSPAPAATPAGSAASWEAVPNPSPAYSSLTSVTVRAAGDVWAVGDSSGSGRSLVEHWDGTAWTAAAGPTCLSVGELPSLAAVTTAPSGRLWTVGSCTTGPLTARYDGHRWTRTAAPDAPRGEGVLSAVVARSDTDVWAVGRGRDATYPRTQPLVEHFDGVRWSAVPSPRVSGGELTAVTAVPGTDQLWAVGDVYTGGRPDVLVEHWDGAAWMRVSPAPGTDQWVFSVTATSASDAWLVGGSLYTHDQPLVEHWDGRAWAVVPGPTSTADATLTSIAASAPDDAWAVGYTTDGALAEHWDGRAWSSSPTAPPASPITYDSLAGVAVVPGTDTVWAVGAATVHDRSRVGLTERYR